MIETDNKKIEEVNSDVSKLLINAHQLKAREIALGNANERKLKLKKLEQSILQHRDAICDGMQKDFNKPATEVDLTEIYPVLLEIRFAISNLSDWMIDKSVPTPLSLFGAKSKIRFEPKGATLIISPWNYPFQLLLAPLVSAIAAGCTAILKPSEYTPHTNLALKQIITECFDADEVSMVEGGVEVSTELLKLKFDHIFFTGSPQVGKIVMSAAAKNLTSVTLELGGKSPTIIDETADLNATVSRIVWAKFINAGQTCIAPDYILIHESQREAFVNKMAAQIERSYGIKSDHSKDFASIINKKHFDRLNNLLNEAETQGAKVVFRGQSNATKNVIAPTLIENISLNSSLMQEEIFGPLLPIITYKEKEEVIDLIQSKEKPLALYVYSKSKKNIDFFLSNTTSGGVGINMSAAHIGNSNLPFGGVNNSGIGKSRGYFGFLEFSNQRAILDQKIKSSVEFLSPPYTSVKHKLISFLMKYF
jgi:aldehyde dehydrogenase (NAD+)